MSETQAAADQRRAALCPAIQANLAGTVEIEVADTGQGRENPRTFPTDVGKGVSQRRLAFLFARRTPGRQVASVRPKDSRDGCSSITLRTSGPGFLTDLRFLIQKKKSNPSPVSVSISSPVTL